jgi:hypothetical protein
MDIQMEELLLGLIDHSSDGVIAIRDGVVVYANGAANRLAGKELTGYKTFELFRSAAIPEIKQCHKDTLVECFFFDKPVQIHVQKKEGLLIFIIQLDEQEDQRACSAGSIAETGNEIRSALAVLMTVLETTLQDSPYWAIAYKNCCRILRSVSSNRFLLITPDEFEKEMETTDVVNRLKKNGEELTQLLQDLSISVSFHTELDRLDAMYHLQAIRRVFISLIGESIRRIGIGGQIRITLAVTENKQDVMISVWDKKGETNQLITDMDISAVDKSVISRIMRLSKGLILRETPKPDEHIATMIFPVRGAEIDYMNIPSLEMKAISQILVELSGVLPSTCYQK